MGAYSRTYSLSNGTTAYGSQVAYELDALGSSVNNIVNAQIAPGAAIDDSKLAQITTASKVSGQALTSLSSTPSGAGELPAANLNIATQAEQETGTDTETIVTSGRQKFHPGTCKGWIYFDGTSGSIGTGAANYNVSSVTDNGTGDWSINWSTVFSSANYCAIGSCKEIAGNAASLNINAISASAVRVVIQDSGGSKTDRTIVCVAAFGDQ